MEWRGSHSIRLGTKGSCTIQVLDHNGFVKVISKGEYKNAKRTVEVNLGQTLGGGLPAAVISKKYPQLNPYVEIIGGVRTGSTSINFNQLRQSIADYTQLISNPGAADIQIPRSVYYSDVTPPQFKGGQIIHIDGDLIFKNERDPAEFNLPVTFIARNVIIEGDVRIYGGVTLVAKHRISLRDNANLVNAILYANHQIIVRDDTFLTGQLLCSGQITLLDHAQLISNGLVYVNNQGVEGRITLANQSFVQGTLVYHGDLPQGIDITIDRAARVDGLVYCQGLIDFRGTVNGHVVTDSLRAMEGRIDATQLSPNFVTCWGISAHAPIEFVNWEAIRPFW